MIRDKKYYKEKSESFECEMTRLREEISYLNRLVDMLKSRPAIYDDAVTAMSRALEANAHVVNDIIQFTERRNKYGIH
jgi:hypothetical protein